VNDAASRPLRTKWTRFAPVTPPMRINYVIPAKRVPASVKHIRGDKPPARREIKMKGTLENTATKGRINPELDSGCERTCVHPKVVKKHGLKTRKIPALPVVNADGSPNRQKVANKVAEMTLQINGHKEQIEPLVLDMDTRTCS
jgi:hypothetical protein